ncbi:hypothetical protein [Streptomyces sp. NPDC091383]|uniref:hypothetical protein n=1 Tax=Streptomyces sp. NPDC091383 TaxID=3365996 RepID=UPI00382C99A3
MNVGQRIAIKTLVEALGHTARPGDKGTIEGVHTGGTLTVLLDNGRPSFPTVSEVEVLADQTLPTVAKTPVMLSKGDVIRDPQGGLHKVTEWEPYPQIAIFFKTDTGIDMRKEWYDQSEYDVVVPRLSDALLSRIRSL